MGATVRKKGRAGKSRKPAERRAKATAKKPLAKRRNPATPKAKQRRRSRPPAPNVYHPGPLIDGEEALSSAAAQLLALDPDLIGALLAAAGPPPLRRRAPGFAGLCWIIVSQQVSTASANAIFSGLRRIFRR